MFPFLQRKQSTNAMKNWRRYLPLLSNRVCPTDVVFYPLLIRTCVYVCFCAEWMINWSFLWRKEITCAISTNQIVRIFDWWSRTSTWLSSILVFCFNLTNIYQSRRFEKWREKDVTRWSPLFFGICYDRLSCSADLFGKQLFLTKLSMSYQQCQSYHVRWYWSTAVCKYFTRTFDGSLMKIFSRFYWLLSAIWIRILLIHYEQYSIHPIEIQINVRYHRHFSSKIFTPIIV